MSPEPNHLCVTFNGLHHYIQLDPIYGVKSDRINSFLKEILHKNSGNVLYSQFQNQFSLLPCKNDQQRKLIYLWCGLMGLPAYQNKTILNWQWEDFLENWKQDFEIRLDDLKDFLRQKSLPLPMAFFPSEVDSTNPYTPYPFALKLLSERIDATPEEIATWVFLGPDAGGLAAYQNANELNPPPRFYYDIGNGDDFDYLSPLMACWFLRKDINDFQPADR